jgi:hypothetical protein
MIDDVPPCKAIHECAIGDLPLCDSYRQPDHSNNLIIDQLQQTKGQTSN